MKSSLSTVKTLIQNGDIESAGQQLLTLTQIQGSRFTNEIIGHLGRWKQIVSDERKGIVSAENIRMSKNQLTYALLDLIAEMEEEKPKAKTASPRGNRRQSKKEGIAFHGDVKQVIIQQSQKGDNVAEKQEKVIDIGPNAHITGSVVISESIQDSFNTIEQANIPADLKDQLKELTEAVNAMIKAMPKDQAADVADDMKKLTEEAVKPVPNKKWYSVSIEGLTKAAENLGKIGEPVIMLAAKVLGQLAMPK